jgi:hypothetical protein
VSARVRITRTAEGAIVVRSGGVTFVEPADNTGDAFALSADGRIGVEDEHGIFRWSHVSDGKLEPDHVVVRAGSDSHPVMDLSEVFEAVRRMRPKVG